MELNKIIVRKAKVHNLKSVDVEIPKNSLTVITGPSGSGKSSLAFDTIYVEGQRRYIESLSSYARQFLGQFQPPDVESISGLSPAIAIDQKTSSRNPRSTVGTVTEIYDYLRVLYARVGTLYSPIDGREIRNWTPKQILDDIYKTSKGAKTHLIALIKGEKASLVKIVKMYQGLGYQRFYYNGKIIDSQVDDIKFDNKNFEIGVVIDRFIIKEGSESRIYDSIEKGLQIGDGTIQVLIDEKNLTTYSEHNMDSKGNKYPELEPRLFSFNSPIGACAKCNGIGEVKDLDPDLMILDDNLSLDDGAIIPLAKKNTFLQKMVETVVKKEKISTSTAIKKLPKKDWDLLFNGTETSYTYKFRSENSNFEFTKPFPGIIAWLEKKYHETSSEKSRSDIESYMRVQTCNSCKGLRLNSVALSTKVADRNIMDISELNITDAFNFFNKIKLEKQKALIAEKLLHEIKSRLGFLSGVGLGYLTLNRSAISLSGGESQRIRLATQIGSALSGVLYVLDEPSIGLHQRDNTKLIATLKSLRDLGNTVLVVEHDEETMIEADHIIDMGPGAGEHGGEIVAEGNFKAICKSNSLTAQFLSHKTIIEVPKVRRKFKDFINLKGAVKNNLKSVDVSIPLGGLACITGVSGSGKSTLIHEILVPSIKALLNKERFGRNAPFKSLDGVTHINSIIELDQSPIGRTPHSNPATYSGLFDEMRKLFSQTPESQIRGYKPGRFSFNVKGGRCEDCEGNGVKKIEMHFLPDVYITCSTCNGSRYNQETLTVLYRGKNIHDVLNMTIEEACEFFKNHPKINRVLSTMNSVGLGYMRLGQPATTLSGGEAQRLKLSSELARRPRGHCLYILDEPTTGLHFQDIKILLVAIQDLISHGHSVVIIEHNLDVIKTADYIIDLGPEGGDGGGTVVATGTPEEIARSPKSFTGQYLKKVLL
ncbi:MAG: excinuclease ABC subunit A [Bdellovibrio sp. CG12_big_fil_rev_8_21_14_0_65_39_13]|nr:MAG: excinuclease ABC subunit A [Bdellovibrio sp. CG22_combo_CG10-13_8_21_14_all_39_27]PIQ60764.1 MAG: excinuclease ABC subunit A [Bdellovibrio sp. CG12_big_fil_rev_8_21_14_0_65_39_13]PIR36387.1 MAG: excinuclease ABC subunit A [Bdellovibrio sp. CG11_big_fil_rev_8_21_14_0_20_39_38]